MPSCCAQCCRSAHSAPHASPLLPTGQYYGLPSLSIRAAAYHLMAQNATGFQGTCPASWVHLLLLGWVGCGPDTPHMVHCDGTAGRSGTATAAASSPVHKPTPSGALLGSRPPPLFPLAGAQRTFPSETTRTRPKRATCTIMVRGWPGPSHCLARVRRRAAAVACSPAWQGAPPAAAADLLACQWWLPPFLPPDEVHPLDCTAPAVGSPAFQLRFFIIPPPASQTRCTPRTAPATGP